MVSRSLSLALALSLARVLQRMVGDMVIFLSMLINSLYMGDLQGELNILNAFTGCLEVSLNFSTTTNLFYDQMCSEISNLNKRKKKWRDEKKKKLTLYKTS